MVEGSEQQYGTYRCPVCGHRDGIELNRGEAGIVECSYCETRLEVSARGPDSVRFTAQVAAEPVAS